ncbi:hypothetical protein [uncultured Chryseobacterium sp.]|uniref:hypothetical protein n=1 Tax=uncultured Chryseobacterium sp. TaxID=259322 RepID=UPI0025FE2C6D|nr:hypothetical protein [uncultured Chryseobacterium sp.]
MAELKPAKLVSDAELNPEELLAVKNAFEEARILAKDEKLVAENDVAKVKSLLRKISTDAKNGSKITGKIEGLYSEIDPNYKPKGFESIKDIEDFNPKYGREITTSFDNYDGYFIRNLDSKNKIFTFNHGFIEDLPKWVEDVKIPLVEGKGIPTQAYFTLRQMKLLKIAEGEIQTVRMAQIQNLETMGYIHQVTGGKIIRNFDSIDILATPSNGYMKTVMTQAGYETISGRITGKGQYLSVKQLRPYFDITTEYMQKYNLSESSMLYMNFNIEVKVKYIKK